MKTEWDEYMDYMDDQYYYGDNEEATYYNRDVVEDLSERARELLKELCDLK